MSKPDWSELERAWKSSPVEAAPALEVIKRQQRRRFGRRLYLLSEIVIAIASTLLALWVMTIQRPLMPELGAFLLVFTAAICGLSLWARSVPKPRADDSVGTALALAIRRAMISVRIGLSIVWGVCGTMVLTAGFWLYLLSIPDFPLPPARTLAMAFCIWSLYCAGLLGAGFQYYRARCSDLARLRAFETALHADAIL